MTPRISVDSISINLQGGVTGIVVQGSNGEAQHLSHEERKEATSLTRKTLDENGFQTSLLSQAVAPNPHVRRRSSAQMPRMLVLPLC